MGIDSELEQIAVRVIDFIDRNEAAPLGFDAKTEEDFDRTALEVFAFQYRRCDVYRRFCDRRSRTPDTISHWWEIPAVPTSAFKSLELACGPAERTFLTSGTTAGSEHRGRHHIPRLELYRRSALPHFRRMVLPDGLRPEMLGLLGGPDLLPDSSLTQMVEWIRMEICDGEGAYLVDGSPFDPARTADRIEEAARSGGPLCLIGVRVIFTALLDFCRQTGRQIELPAGSRIVDTGGPKGGRALSDAGFLRACWQFLGVAGYDCINEYGMTELCSQYYDDVLYERFTGHNRARRKAGPAWLRPRIVDPETLEPLEEGETGLVCHIDLANALSVLAVQTEDLGTLEDGRLTLRGRAPDAIPRGCALALADILQAQP